MVVLQVLQVLLAPSLSMTSSPYYSVSKNQVEPKPELAPLVFSCPLVHHSCAEEDVRRFVSVPGPPGPPGAPGHGGYGFDQQEVAERVLGLLNGECELVLCVTGVLLCPTVGPLCPQKGGWWAFLDLLDLQVCLETC